jgi:RNA polymerase sigma-70 factor (ECF subfamily)
MIFMMHPRETFHLSEQPFGAALEAARAGDRAALGRLLEGYRAYLELLADRELGVDLRAKVGASDLVQKTFLDAQKGLHEFRGRTPAELLGWLQRMLLNNLSDHARQFRATAKRQVQREIALSESWADTPGPADLSTPSRQVSATEEQARVQAALDRLPAHYRRVVLLRNMEKLSFAEVGRRLGRTEEAAKKLWGRAILRLKQDLNAI